VAVLRVLHVDTGATWRGGQAQVLGLLREQRADATLEPLLAAEAGGELHRRAQEEGFTVLPFGGGAFNPLGLLRIARALRARGDVDLVHTHSSHALLVGAVLRRLGLARKHVHTRRVDFPVGRNMVSRWKYLRGCDHIIAISEGVRAVLESCGVPAQRITVVHSGIPPRPDPDAAEADAVREELGWPRPRRILLCVGALTDHKGHRYLLEALPPLFARHGDLLCVLAGDGELRHKLEDQARRLGIADRVRFLGHRDDVPRLLAAADLFVLASHLEGMGTSILDAMWFRLPVVATRTGGIPDAVEHGVTGLLVPPRDPAALARAIAELLEDRERARRFGAAGRERVARGFLVGHMAAGTRAVYRSLCCASA
jgi:glycosyltransferase involved in cell wall biosynthesis